ncbi:MAG: ATP synthase F1 subunit delta [Pseudomonadota bacterium]
MAKASLSAASEAAQRYASALFELAQDKGQLADIHRDFSAFAALVRENAELSALVSSPAYGRAEKTAALTEVAKEAGVSPLLVNFIGVVAQNGRSRELHGTQRAFDTLYANQRGVRRATVRTAKPMSDSQRSRMTDILAKTVGSNVEITEEVDAALIGGVQLQIGSKLVDASIASKLDRMNAAMKGA